jgi:type IX secretion system PorP/SprF family membrane protein
MKTKTTISIINKGCYICLLFLFIINYSANAQDIHFSQFDETPVQLNPSNVGVHHEIQAIANYKNQWQSIASPFKTFAMSFDARLLKRKKNHIGLGFDFFNDRAGDANVTSNQFNVSLSGIVPLSRKSLFSGGLMCGYASHTINTSALTWGNQYNGMQYQSNIASGEPAAVGSFGYVDLGAGINYSYGTDEMYISANNARKINLGVSVFHPHQPVYSFYGDASQRLYTKFVFNGNAAIGLKNTNLVLKPSYIVFLQGPTKEITPGMMFQYILQESSKYTGNKKPAAFSIGGYYRVRDALIAVVKFEYANYEVGFSYDINLSQLRTVSSTRGGFEISLRFVAPSMFAKPKTEARF